MVPLNLSLESLLGYPRMLAHPNLALVPECFFCYRLIMKETDKAHAAILAKAITAICVRNGFLEDLHSGITPSSKAGDYSDVKVVTPYGEIPWEKVSRISDVEMKH